MSKTSVALSDDDGGHEALARGVLLTWIQDGDPVPEGPDDASWQDWEFWCEIAGAGPELFSCLVRSRR